ncbi:S8 family serine peptidase [Streptomyces sp. NPDC001658]
MSQEHPGRRRRVGRRTVSLLAPALAGGLVLSYGTPVQAASQDATPGTSRQAQQTFTDGLYVVQLADRPVATESSTAPDQGERLDTATGAVREYVRHLKREREKVLDAVRGVKPLYTYQYVLNGFSAELTAGQATALSRTPGVLSVAKNMVSHPTATSTATSTATTEAETAAAAGALAPADTAKFLGLDAKGGLYSKIPGGRKRAGEGTILGVIDTGIATANPSLKALPEPRPDAAVIAKKWKGACDPGVDLAHLVTCNNKVIGAQYFNKGIADPKPDDWASPMDAEGHGTHTATTAAGDTGVNATVPDSGIAGSIRGLAPAARIAAYKVCWTDGCSTSDIVAAFDKAVADGVDVINYSVGGPNDEPANRPEYTAMFNAAKAGVFISASSGNSGPGTGSNGVPWVTTVAASTHDTGYRGTLTLGDGKTYDGVSIAAQGVPSAPLVDGAEAARSGVDATAAGQCQPDSLDPAEVKGAVVICARGGNARLDKSAQVKAEGGVGMVLYNVSAADEEVADAHTVPSVHVPLAAGEAIKAYAAGSGATAALTAAKAVKQQSPQMAGFSSSGPDLNSGGDLLKPDITAPGVDIVAGTAAHGTFPGDQGMMSGTSMSAPHVSGLALLLRQLHPDWSPMEVKSALMTTATTKDNAGKPIQRSGKAATPLDYGAGHVVPNTAYDPGLVYDSTSAEWTAYLCAIGQPPLTADGGDACATARKTDPSDLNNPTIAVGDLVAGQTVTRRVTNVTGTAGVYTAAVEAPAGYKATISPKTLKVPAGKSATYKVAFTRTTAAFDSWAFGAVTLTDQRHTVRSAVALRAAPLRAAAEATGKGRTGSTALSAKAGFSGSLTTKVYGLYAGTTTTGTLTGTAESFDPSKPTAASARTEVTIPENTSLARVGILPSDHLKGSDLDLWVLDKDGRLVSALPVRGSDEHVDLRPGTYQVYVNQYGLPEGATSQKYTLHTWLVGPGTKADKQATVTPAKQSVTSGAAPKVTVSWRDLKAGSAYVGVVHYGRGTETVGATALTVTP